MHSRAAKRRTTPVDGLHKKFAVAQTNSRFLVGENESSRELGLLKTEVSKLATNPSTLGQQEHTATRPNTVKSPHWPLFANDYLVLSGSTLRLSQPASMPSRCYKAIPRWVPRLLLLLRVPSTIASSCSTLPPLPPLPLLLRLHVHPSRSSSEPSDPLFSSSVSASTAVPCLALLRCPALISGPSFPTTVASLTTMGTTL